MISNNDTSDYQVKMSANCNDMIDDLWIDIALSLPYQDFLHFHITCKRFHHITTIASIENANVVNNHDSKHPAQPNTNTQYNNNFSKKINKYWHDQTNLLCNNLPLNYDPKNWYLFYIQFRKIFVRQYHRNQYNSQTKHIDFNKVEQECIDKYHPIIQCCRIDTPLIFEMMLKADPKLGNMNIQIQYRKPPSFYLLENDSNYFGYYQRSLSLQKYLMCLLFECLLYNSIDMIKHLFNKYSQDVIFNYYPGHSVSEGENTTLLIEAMKTGNDEIIQLILNHPNCNKSVVSAVTKVSNINPLHSISQCAKYAYKLKESQRISINTINSMIDKGVNINGQNWNGETPLHLLVTTVAKETYIKYQAKKVNFNSDDNVNVKNKSLGDYFMTIIEHLINLDNINTNIVNKYERTPLDEALRWPRIDTDGTVRNMNKRTKLVKLLLTAKDGNKNVGHINPKNGINVFHHAIANGHYNLIECLYDHLNKYNSDIDMNKLINGQTTQSTKYNQNIGTTPYILACKYISQYWDIENVQNLNGIMKMFQILINQYHANVIITDETGTSGSDMLYLAHKRIVSKKKQFEQFRLKLKKCEREYPQCFLTDPIVTEVDPKSNSCIICTTL